MPAVLNKQVENIYMDGLNLLSMMRFQLPIALRTAKHGLNTIIS